MMAHFPLSPGLIKKFLLALGAFVGAFFILIGVIISLSGQAPIIESVPSETQESNNDIPLTSSATDTVIDFDQQRISDINITAKRINEVTSQDGAIA